MGILYSPTAFFIRTVVHFLFPAYAVITTEEHQMRDPFRTAPELIEENAFLHQGTRTIGKREHAGGGSAGTAILPSGRGFPGSTTLPQPITI
jgi:hypothetical protein